jgi:type III restriction enzyme
MLQAIKDIQNKAIDKVISLLKVKNDVTFKSPTGSGKTYMMAKIMSKMLECDQNIVFIVSSLSKSGLANQNHKKFENDYKNDFLNLKPKYIEVDVSSEENVYIPLEYNVYSLGRDKYKKGTKLMKGAFVSFLDELKKQNKKIILIKDECHQATNNLDNLKNEYFEKTLNLSATPKITQIDCKITNQEAMDVKLIKKIERSDSNDIRQAFDKLLLIKERYNNGLHINPCLIVQISNKDKGEEE